MKTTSSMCLAQLSTSKEGLEGTTDQNAELPRSLWSLTRCCLGHALSKPSCCDCRLDFVGHWLPGYEHRIQNLGLFFKARVSVLGKIWGFWAKQNTRFLLGIFQLWGLWDSPNFQGTFNTCVLAWALPECEHCKDRKEIEYCESVEQGSSQQTAKLLTVWDCSALLGNTVVQGPVTLYSWPFFSLLSWYLMCFWASFFHVSICNPVSCPHSQAARCS